MKTSLAMEAEEDLLKTIEVAILVVGCCGYSLGFERDSLKVWGCVGSVRFENTYNYFDKYKSNL